MAEPARTPPSRLTLSRQGAQSSGWRRLPALAGHPATFVGVTGLVVLVVGLLVGYGYWNSYIRPARAPAVRVGERTYDMAYFARRMKAALNDPTAGAASQQVFSLPQRLAQDIVDEEVFLQRAHTLGVGVSDAEIDRSLAERLGVAYMPDAEGNVMATPAFASAVRTALQRSGLTLAEFRRAAHAQRLRTAVRQHFQNQIPKELPAVRLRQLAVADEARAKELKQQIEAGADFAQLASAFSEDALTKEKGGLRDWAPQGYLPAEFERLAYSLPLGQLSEPFQNAGLWVILRVEERQDAREVGEQERDQLVTRRVNEWLADQRKMLGAVHYLDKRDREMYALEHSGAIDILRRRGLQQPIFPGGNP